MITMQQDRTLDELIARHAFAKALTCALSDPHQRRHATIWCDEHTELLQWAWESIKASQTDLTTDPLGLGELLASQAAIEPLVRWLATPLATRAAVFQRVFGLVVSKLCPPYETEYCHWNDPTYRAHQLADIAGFYQAFALEPNPTEPDRHDHIALEIEFIAFVLHKRIWLANSEEQANDADHDAVCREALATFMRDHLVWWAPTFAKCLERRIDQVLSPNLSDADREGLELFRGAAQVLRAWVAAERCFNSVAPSRRIIAPQVESHPPDDACASCGDASESCV